MGPGEGRGSGRGGCGARRGLAGRLPGWEPAVRHYATPALRLAKPQPKATQNKASQNLEGPSFPGVGGRQAQTLAQSLGQSLGPGRVRILQQ